MGSQKSWFARFSTRLSQITGRASTFALAVVVVVVWGISGPLFHFSDTWQLVINTSTTIVTFLMVFIIQNTQNRDTAAMQIKLDELIRAIDGTHRALLDLEELDEKDLEKFREEYERLARDARDGNHSASDDVELPSPSSRVQTD
jgi:low affinity Fe/Cu permease